MARSVSTAKQTSGFSIDPNIVKQFHPIDLVADEYIDQLVAKATVIDIQKGEYIFKSSRCLSLSYYLLSGKVNVMYKSNHKKIDAIDPDCYYPLDYKQPTETSVKALSHCQVLQFNRHFINQLISMKPSAEFDVMTVASIFNSNLMDHKSWLDSLSESPLLQHFSAADIYLLYSKLEHITVREGETISCNGQSAGYFYIIKNGHAERRLDAAGKNHIILQPGDYFGEEIIAKATVRSNSVRMISDGVLARLAYAEFNEILRDSLERYTRETDIQTIIEDVNACIVLDVRLPAEFIHCHSEQSCNVPISQLCDKLPLFDKSKLYLITPEGGRCTELAIYMLREAGFDAYLLDDDQAGKLDKVG